jgi:hypothetical protein
MGKHGAGQIQVFEPVGGGLAPPRDRRPVRRARTRRPPGTAPAGAAVRTGQAGNQFPQATPATLVSEGPPTRPVGLPTTFAPPEDLSRATVAARRTIVFSENDAADKFSINGKQFDPNRVDIQSKLNNRFPAAARAARCGRSPLRCPVNAGHDQAGGQR